MLGPSYFFFSVISWIRHGRFCLCNWLSFHTQKLFWIQVSRTSTLDHVLTIHTRLHVHYTCCLTSRTRQLTTSSSCECRLHPDGVLKSTVRTKILYYRRLYDQWSSRSHCLHVHVSEYLSKYFGPLVSWLHLTDIPVYSPSGGCPEVSDQFLLLRYWLG